MGSQRMSAKNTRRWGRRLGLDLAFMVAHGGYEHAFVTADHRHGTVDIRTGEWRFVTSQAHYASCREMFDDA